MELRGQHVEGGSSGTAVSDKAGIARSLSMEARTLPLVRWGCRVGESIEEVSTWSERTWRP